MKRSWYRLGAALLFNEAWDVFVDATIHLSDETLGIQEAKVIPTIYWNHVQEEAEKTDQVSLEDHDMISIEPYATNNLLPLPLYCRSKDIVDIRAIEPKIRSTFGITSSAYNYHEIANI